MSARVQSFEEVFDQSSSLASSKYNIFKSMLMINFRMDNFITFIILIIRFYNIPVQMKNYRIQLI